MKTANIIKGIALLATGIVMSQQTFAQQDLPKNNGSKQYIHIQTMRIENGDTIVTEKNYESDGNGSIQFNDSLRPSDGTFGFNYQIEPFSDFSDSAYTENWKQMEKMLNDMNSINFNFFGDYPDINFEFPIDPDSLLQEFEMQSTDSVYIGKHKLSKYKKYSDTVINLEPFSHDNLNNKGNIHTKNDRQIFVSEDTRKIAPNSKNEVENFNILINPEENIFNLSFNLDNKKPSRITFEDASGKVVYEENLGKGMGQFNRQFDLQNYSNGVYYLSVIQGKKSSCKRVILQ
jgi:hypothetical protein